MWYKSGKIKQTLLSGHQLDVERQVIAVEQLFLTGDGTEYSPKEVAFSLAAKMTFPRPESRS